MRRPFALLVVLLVAVTAPGCGSSDHKSQDKVGGERVSLLYALNAESGTLRPTSVDDRFILTLSEVAPRVTAFSDRPQRLTFTAATATFFSLWDQQFGGDPPNAALDGIDATGQVVVLELTNPRLSGRTLRVDARRLKSADDGLSHYAKRLHPNPPARFGEASLFIDTSQYGEVEAINLYVENCVDARGATTEDRDLLETCYAEAVANYQLESEDMPPG